MAELGVAVVTGVRAGFGLGDNFRVGVADRRSESAAEEASRRLVEAAIDVVELEVLEGNPEGGVGLLKVLWGVLEGIGVRNQGEGSGG